MNILTEYWIPFTLVAIALVAIAVLEAWRKGRDRGYDLGKIDGLHEGWKNRPERDSRGRYKAKV